MEKEIRNRLIYLILNSDISAVNPWKLQNDLMVSYADVNPRFRLQLSIEEDVEDKVYLRQIMGYLEEEIWEFGKQYKDTVQLILANPGDKALLEKSVWGIFEEISDIFHFIIEVFILTGVEESDINDNLDNLLKPWGLTSDNIYKGGFLYAGHFLTHLNDIWVHPGADNPAMDLVIPNIRGCRKTTDSFMEGLTRHLYNFMAYSKSATREISYKPWKLKNKPTNITAFSENFFNTFLYFFVLMIYLGVNEYTLKAIFKIKNEINLKRIISGY